MKAASPPAGVPAAAHGVGIDGDHDPARLVDVHFSRIALPEHREPDDVKLK